MNHGILTPMGNFRDEANHGRIFRRYEIYCELSPLLEKIIEDIKNYEIGKKLNQLKKEALMDIESLHEEIINIYNESKNDKFLEVIQEHIDRAINLINGNNSSFFDTSEVIDLLKKIKNDILFHGLDNRQISTVLGMLDEFLALNKEKYLMDLKEALEALLSWNIEWEKEIFNVEKTIKFLIEKLNENIEQNESNYHEYQKSRINLNEKGIKIPDLLSFKRLRNYERFVVNLKEPIMMNYPDISEVSDLLSRTREADQRLVRFNSNQLEELISVLNKRSTYLKRAFTEQRGSRGMRSAVDGYYRAMEDLIEYSNTHITEFGGVPNATPISIRRARREEKRKQTRKENRMKIKSNIQ